MLPNKFYHPEIVWLCLSKIPQKADIRLVFKIQLLDSEFKVPIVLLGQVRAMGFKDAFIVSFYKRRRLE